MEADFVSRLNAQSTIAELPTYDRSLELSVRGEVLGKTFDREPWLPGVVVTGGGAIRGVISRGQYLKLVGRYLGLEVYHPRPIRLILKALTGAEETLVMPPHTPIQQAVRQALERPREMIYEPIVLHGEGPESGAAKLQLIDFPDLLRADAQISALRNQQMHEILSTVREGFLLVGPDHVIASEHSRHLGEIFETDWIAGRRFPGLLTAYLGEEKAALGRDYLKTLFNPNVIERLVTQINPLMRVTARMPGSQRRKHLAFRFYRSVENGVIRRVLVRVEDTTREVEMAAELEAQERRAREQVNLALDIVRADADQLSRFLVTFDQQLERSMGLLSRNGGGPPAGERLDALFRHIHALKGEAGMLSLQTYQARIHRFEDAIVALRARPNVGPGDLPALRPGLDDLRRLAADTRAVIDQFRKLGGSPAPAASAQHGGAQTVATATSPAGLFASISQLVEELSARLGKPARFLSRNPEAEVPEKYRELLREVLVQLARNAMVHGLERPAERRQRGKPATGTLQLALRHHPARQRLELIFQDDGGGLDLERIRSLAHQRGLAATDDEALAQLIFESGFSTAEKTTVDAGRGVGMDLVKARVEAHGGAIRPYSQPGAYCAFQIVLPA